MNSAAVLGIVLASEHTNNYNSFESRGGTCTPITGYTGYVTILLTNELLILYSRTGIPTDPTHTVTYHIGTNGAKF